MSPLLVQSAHLATGRRALGEALHFHRHFGGPLASFSDEHNRMRAEANARTVYDYAYQAGRYAAYSGRTLLWTWMQWACCASALTVPAIRASFEAGLRTTLTLLGRELAADWDTPSAPPPAGAQWGSLLHG